nr:reverse transcriptase domain-containing protein [Tanacetum cinerariifolium]GEZ76388.1 reverse transcriptase domain-containing protein [Tanacetum cinerariifolium]
MDLKQGEVVKAKYSIEEPPELELKDLPSHLEYAYLEGVYKLPVILAKDLKVDEKEALLKRRIINPLCKVKDGLTQKFMRFIQDFSKIARPMTHLLEKETLFVFSKDCIDVFATLKKKLTEASILVIPDWNLPFELMCDASDFAICAVLGKRKTKHFQPIHYASKTMTEAQIHYTTTEKEMLTVLYAFEKFRPYLVLSKSIVYTDHLALKYLLSKQDAKPRMIRTAYKTPIGCTLYKLVYGKSCHLPIELEHKAYWALKHVNFDLKTAGDHRKLQLNKLRDQAYENSLIYERKTKKIHDSKIKNRIFNVDDRVLLFNYRLKIFLRKLKTH